MRLLTIAAATALLMLSAAAPAGACSGPSMHSAQIASTDLSATIKRPMKKKVAKKTKEKVEYMRAVPMN